MKYKTDPAIQRKMFNMCFAIFKYSKCFFLNVCFIRSTVPDLGQVDPAWSSEFEFFEIFSRQVFQR